MGCMLLHAHNLARGFQILVRLFVSWIPLGIMNFGSLDTKLHHDFERQSIEFWPVILLRLSCGYPGDYYDAPEF